MDRDRPGLVTSEMVTMDSFVDKAGEVAAKTGEFVDERSGGGAADSRAVASYSLGVPTAESYADDSPGEWSYDEGGSEPEPIFGLAESAHDDPQPE
jgi:hypothetical protein